MNNLPEDMLLYIKKTCYNSSSLLNLKKTNKQFNKLITRFSIQKIICSNLYKNFVNKYRINCININCEKYIHYQRALNETNIIINNKEYRIFTSYCSKCLKKYVLIDDNIII
jgi:hypothetical protein